MAKTLPEPPDDELTLTRSSVQPVPSVVANEPALSTSALVRLLNPPPIVARTEDGTVVAYDCRLCAGIPELLEIADERLGATGRQLSAEEFELYLGR
jgi:hypothetical protein